MRSELAVGEYNFAFRVLLAFAFINVQLANQTVINEMSRKATKDANQVFELV